MLMDPDNTAVNHQIFQVGITGNGFKNSLPYPFMGPTVIPDVHAMPMAIVGREITPRSPCSGNPENSFEKQAIVLCRDATITAFSRKQGGKALPLVVS